MSKEVIVFITEGEKTEPQILDNIKKNFFNNDPSMNKEYIFLSFRADIYQLYRKITEDELETEIIELLIERNPQIENQIEKLDKGKRSISQVFLFFDYDGQAYSKPGGDEIIKKMIDMFDNETELGKIYVSYPMTEAIKDLKKQETCSRRCKVEAKVNIKYKNKVSNDTEFKNLTQLDKAAWDLILEKNIKKSNCIVESTFSIPKYSEYIEKITQDKIFENQLNKYINIDNTIAVLSGFPLFLVDFYGEPLYETINQNKITCDCSIK